MKNKKTKEPQYQNQIEIAEAKGLTPLGLMTNQVYHDDPRRLVFILARYKFVSKMLSGRKQVLEVGFGDAFGSRIVQQEVAKLTAVDFDPFFVEEAKKRGEEKWPVNFMVHDMTKEGPVAKGKFDAGYAIDVLEHIPPEKEKAFMDNFTASLTKHSCLILGIPSLGSQEYSSPQSKAGHVNCQNHKQFKNMMEKYFHHVFLFSMNDEVVHTGFYPMANYLFAIGCEKK